MPIITTKNTKVALLYNFVLEWVTNRKVKCSIIPIKSPYPAITLRSARIMELQTKVYTDNNGLDIYADAETCI